MRMERYRLFLESGGKACVKPLGATVTFTLNQIPNAIVELPSDTTIARYITFTKDDGYVPKARDRVDIKLGVAVDGGAEKVYLLMKGYVTGVSMGATQGRASKSLLISHISTGLNGPPAGTTLFGALEPALSWMRDIPMMTRLLAIAGDDGTGAVAWLTEGQHDVGKLLKKVCEKLSEAGASDLESQPGAVKQDPLVVDALATLTAPFDTGLPIPDPHKIYQEITAAMASNWLNANAWSLLVGMASSYFLVMVPTADSMAISPEWSGVKQGALVIRQEDVLSAETNHMVPLARFDAVGVPMIRSKDNEMMMQDTMGYVYWPSDASNNPVGGRVLAATLPPWASTVVETSTEPSPDLLKGRVEGPAGSAKSSDWPKDVLEEWCRVIAKALYGSLAWSDRTLSIGTLFLPDVALGSLVTVPGDLVGRIVSVRLDLSEKAMRQQITLDSVRSTADTADDSAASRVFEKHPLYKDAEHDIIFKQFLPVFKEQV